MFRAVLACRADCAAEGIPDGSRRLPYLRSLLWAPAISKRRTWNTLLAHEHSHGV